MSGAETKITEADLVAYADERLDSARREAVAYSVNHYGNAGCGDCRISENRCQCRIVPRRFELRQLRVPGWSEWARNGR